MTKKIVRKEIYLEQTLYFHKKNELKVKKKILKRNYFNKIFFVYIK
jgi:hypothetical protein